MPVAAVPEYLGKDFTAASPGLRFGMLLPVWGQDQRTQAIHWATHDIVHEVRGQQHQERKVKKENKVSALQQACKLSPSDKSAADALAKRQALSFATMPAAQGLCIQATAVAPFTTGLGNEHPLENGFAFLNPYGLPYLPGSGVKGVLRQAAKELALGEWGESHWSTDQRHEVQDRNGKCLFDANDLDVLFGSEALQGQDHLRGVLSFWDVIPQIEGNSLMVEIMTPHQTHYYQQDSSKGAGSTSPHDSGSPNPISFLTVPPKSAFAFHVVCDTEQLQRLAPDLCTNERWKTLITQAFEHAFRWLGFGAKTSVGYGAMKRDTKAEAKRVRELAEAQAAAAKAKKMTNLSENARCIATFVQDCESKLTQLRGKKEKPNTDVHRKAVELAKTALESPGWTPDEKRAAADALTEWLPKVVEIDMKNERKKLKLATLRGEA